MQVWEKKKGVSIHCEVSVLVCVHVVLYWEDFAEMCVSSLSSADYSVDFVSFLCPSASGDGIKHLNFGRTLQGAPKQRLLSATRGSVRIVALSDGSSWNCF